MLNKTCSSICCHIFVGKQAQKRTLKPGVVPSLLLPSSKQLTVAQRQRRDRRKQKEEKVSKIAANITKDIQWDINLGATIDVQHCAEPEIMPAAALHKATQTTSLTTTHTASQTEKLSSYIDTLNDEHLHYYTGLGSREKFDMVLATLGSDAHNLRYYYSQTKPPLDIPNQLLLTLTKLRTHPPNTELAFRFTITVKQVSNIFITWINFMYRQWKQIKWWPSQELTRFYAPASFKETFPDTRAILDGTECPIKQPKQPSAQQSTFSTYKNRNTMKVIVGSTPGGLVSYISDAYGGSTSDRQITERSNLTSLTDAGDELMVDKGFNIEDIFIPHHVRVNMPSIFKKKNRLSQTLLHKDRKVASKRVHIERVIGLGKTYKILCQPMDHIETALATEIITVVYLLCNFRKCIIPA